MARAALHCAGLIIAIPNPVHSLDGAGVCAIVLLNSRGPATIFWLVSPIIFDPFKGQNSPSFIHYHNYVMMHAHTIWYVTHIGME
jgi:hypothetical protein